MPTSRSCGAKKSAKTAMIDSDRKAPLFDLAAKRVYVAGHNGMVGAAIVRRLKSEPCQILTTDRATLDRTRISSAKPDAIFVAAAKVGGIAFNSASCLAMQPA
jgi:hypothetical protein